MIDGPILFAAVLLCGLLAGNEVATLIAFHPVIRRLPIRAQVEVEQSLTRLLGVIMPVYMTATLVATIGAAFATLGTPAFVFALLAAGAIGLMLVITLTQNLPLNKRTLDFPPDGDERSWSEIRRRWERIHLVRVILDVSAFACAILALAAR
ncbi:MAG: DUF1772 domain-containing protein [Chloroflexi bacterium]|nr:DUF1772 domain-containing protein [Chloroflexota bacterium]HEV8053544.1 DUF1772 domain-containing protein [Candidatus Limnocylindrales bacterium]